MLSARHLAHGRPSPHRFAGVLVSRRWTWLLPCTLALAAIGCAPSLSGTKDLDEARLGERTLVAGDGFEHLIYRRGDWKQPGPVHVYLEGDGLPWITRTAIARDPTPRNPLALRLMTKDPAPSLYLGRPCYHGLADAPGCSPWLWTHGRYSEEVARSMAAALRRALATVGDREIMLIGYSGGGVLAMLIAARVEQVTRVVSVAANLDIDAWTRHHGYSRLRGSLNPATLPPLPSRVRQIHLAGGRDVLVPPDLSRPVANRQPNADFLVIPEFDHRCCWKRDWPSILARLDKPGANRAGAAPAPGLAARRDRP
jgi:hypothetical protein